MDKTYQLFREYLKRDWYVQGFSAVPLFLSTAAKSGTFMKRYLGFGYRHFLFSYYEGYGEMAYDPQDLKRIWRIVRRKLKTDPGYLRKVKAIYLKNLRHYQPFFKNLAPEKLAKLKDDELIKIFQQLTFAQVDGVGVSHIIDAIGVGIEEDFKNKLRAELPQASVSRFNEVFSTLITPSRISFVNQEERDLLAIKGGLKNIKALERHAAKYFWLHNSYAGPKYLTARDFQEKLKNLRQEKIKPLRTAALKLKYRFSPELKKMRDVIDYCAVWQDERKAVLFKNISNTGLVLGEISRRLHERPEYFYYLGLNEIERIKLLADLKKKVKILKERKRGCLVVIKGLTDKTISGSGYNKLLSGRHVLLEKQDFQNQELHGTVANTGTASGLVKIIRNINSLKDFQAGNILVASMTRPEYMSAIKKAAAIITDEGGITCHAAIIARELNIPTIIGTKIATQILHDGERVEVRANHGVIKILD